MEVVNLQAKTAKASFCTPKPGLAFGGGRMEVIDF
jgi:hypothetical protein